MATSAVHAQQPGNYPSGYPIYNAPSSMTDPGDGQAGRAGTYGMYRGPNNSTSGANWSPAGSDLNSTLTPPQMFVPPSPHAEGRPVQTGPMGNCPGGDCSTTHCAPFCDHNGRQTNSLNGPFAPTNHSHCGPNGCGHSGAISPMPQTYPRARPGQSPNVNGRSSFNSNDSIAPSLLQSPMPSSTFTGRTVPMNTIYYPTNVNYGAYRNDPPRLN